MGFEEEDDDYEEEGDGANRLFGFMFGNVDDSGDLDADYLEEDAKEHLAAVADKLGTSFRDIHSSCSDAAEEDDYDEKAEDAVDIDEQYEGPEEKTEEDYLLPRKEFFSTVTAFGNTGSLYDDENYDEDDDGDDDLEDEDDGEDDLESTAFADELESEMLALGKTGSVSDDENYDEDDDGLEDKDEVAEDRTEVQPAHSSGEKIDEDALESDEFAGELESEMLAALDTSESEEAAFNEPLPILCVEDGAEILRFSELFALTSKKVGNKWKYPLPKERLKPANVEVNVEEDEEAFLRESSKNIFDVREEENYTLTSTDYYSSGSNQGSDCFQCSEPLGENLPPLDFNIPELSHLNQLNWEDDIVWDNSPAHDHAIAESVEPLGSCLPEKAFHPQLLRLESRFIQQNPDNDAMRHFNKMLVPNRDLMEGSWMDHIVWETDKPVTKPKLILDLQDEQMLFEISDAEEKYKHLMTHARAMIVTRPNAGVSVRGPSEGRFNISNDEHISKPKSSQQLKSNVKKRTALKKVQTMKKRIAPKVQTMKAKSKSSKDVVNFLKKHKKIDKEQDGLMNKKVKIKSIDGVKIEEEKKTSREGFVCGACGQPNHMRTNKLCPNKSGGKPKTLTKKKLILKDKLTPEGKILKIKFKCGKAEKLTPARPATSDADTGNKDVKVNRMKIVFSEVVESSEEHQNQNQNQKQETDQNQPRKKIKIKIRQLKEITNVNQEGSEEQAASKRKREKEPRASDLQEHEILAGIRKFEEELNMDAEEEEEEERLRAKKKRKVVLLNRNC